MRKGQRGPERSAMDLAAVHRTTGMVSPNTPRASLLFSQPSLLRGPSRIPPLLYPVLPLPCGHCPNECPSPAGDGCEWRPHVLANNCDVKRADKPANFRA